MAKLGNYWKGFYFNWFDTFIELSILIIGLSILIGLLIYSIKKLYCINTSIKDPTSSSSSLRSGIASRSNSPRSQDSPDHITDFPVSPTSSTTPTTPNSFESSSNGSISTSKSSSENSIKNIKWHNKLLLISSLSWSIIQVLCSLVTLICMILFGLPVPCGARTMNIIPLSFQRLSLYLYFILRIYDTFKLSAYRINKSMLITFCIIQFIYLLTVVPWFTYNGWYYAKGENGIDCDYYQLVGLTIVMIFVDLGTNIFLGVLFVKKLNQVGRGVVTNGDQSTSHGGKNNGKRKENEEGTNVLRKLVRKLFTLLVVNIVVSALSLSLIFVLLAYSGACIDLIVSNICFLLCFHFNQKYYEKFCNCCGGKN